MPLAIRQVTNYEKLRLPSGRHKRCVTTAAEVKG